MSDNIIDSFLKNHAYKSINNTNNIQIANNNDKTVCGIGSLKVNNIEFLNFLNEIIKKYNINSVLDLGCGDLNYINEYIIKSNLRYLGLDASIDLTNYNIDTYKQYDNLNFGVCNIIKDNIPKNYDLILIKEVFIHFSDDLIIKSLNNIKNSNPTYLLISGHTENFQTKDHFNNLGWGFRKFESEKFIHHVFNNYKLIETFSDSNNIRKFNLYSINI